MRTPRRAAVALTGALVAASSLAAGTAAAVLSVPADPATVTARARSLTQVTGVTATAGTSAVTLTWSAETSGLSTGYRVLRYDTSSGGTATTVCTTTTASTCADTTPPAAGGFYTVTALLTPSGASAPAWTGPESARAASGPTGLQPPSTPDLEAASDSGTSSTDDITNSTSLSFVGTGTPGATVTLTITSPGQTTITLTGTVVAAGTWRIAASGVPNDGVRAVTARQTSNATTSGTSAALSVTVDRTAPVVAITGVVSAQGNNGQGTVTGTAGVLAGDLSPIGLTFTSSAPVVITTATTTASGTGWSYFYTLTKGKTYTMAAEQKDVAGNTGTASRTNVTP